MILHVPAEIIALMVEHQAAKRDYINTPTEGRSQEALTELSNKGRRASTALYGWTSKQVAGELQK